MPRKRDGPRRPATWIRRSAVYLPFVASAVFRTFIRKGHGLANERRAGARQERVCKEPFDEPDPRICDLAYLLFLEELLGPEWVERWARKRGKLDPLREWRAAR